MWFKSLPQSSIGPNPSIVVGPFRLQFFYSKKYWTTKSNIIYPKNFTSRFPEYFNPFFIHAAKSRFLIEFFRSSVVFSLQIIFSLDSWSLKVWIISYEVHEKWAEQHQWLGEIKYRQEAIIFNLHKINIFDKILVSVCDVKMRLSMISYRANQVKIFKLNLKIGQLSNG